MSIFSSTTKLFIGLLTLQFFVACNPQPGKDTIADLPTDSITAIAKEAYIYAYPIVENYRVLYASTMDSSNPKFAPFNHFFHEKNVATAADTLFVAPNGDTPYSYAVLDLRNGPVVLSIPPIDSNRYFGFPLYDLYTHIIYTFSKRTIGVNGGRFLIAPVGWKGEVPKDIKKVVYSETDILYILVRTQLFAATDLNNVHALQQQYSLTPLSVSTNLKPENFVVPPLPPITPQSQPDLRIFSLLNYLLGFCHPHASETKLLQRFSSIGIAAGKPFEVKDSTTKAAILKGIALGQQAMMQKLPSVKFAEELFGTREQLKNDFLGRAVGAWVGIYANQKEEFMGLQGFERQADGKPFVGTNTYTVTFNAGQLPPVDGFWSITLYALPTRFMYANILNRNLINSAMLPSLKKNKDGSITLYIQHESPGADKESNWLPCPKTAFTMAFRTYLPKQPIRDGSWQIPPVVLQPK